jgi:hypothetical protein
MSKFIASFLRGASPINPDIIEVTDQFVIFKKRKLYLIGYDSILIPFTKISSVEINTGIIGTIGDFTKAIKINKKFSEAYHQRGLLKRKLGQKIRGAADLKKARNLPAFIEK